jgi:DNA polymerase-3 subunit delta
VVEPLVLLHGDDPYLVTSAAQRLRGQLSSDLVADLGLEEFRSSRDLDAIARSVATPPFLALRRLVMVWDPPQIAGGQRSAKEVELLIAALSGRLETTAVLVICRSTLTPSSPLLQAVRSQRGEVRLLKRPRGLELRRYVDEQIRAGKLRLGAPVVSRLVEVAGQDLGRFHQELEKLEIFSGGEERVSDAEALLLVPPAPPTELFRLTDALFEDPGRVGDRLAEMSGRSDLPPPVVVGALARAFRDLVSFAEQPGAGLPPWKEDKLRSHLKRAGETRLRRWLVELADLDWATRTGAVDGQEGLELLLAGMASELNSQLPG